MSEPVFTVFTLLSVLFALKVNHSANPIWPLLAGCSAAYAILIRYAGIFLLASFLVCFAVRQVQLRDRRTLRDVGLVGFPPSVVVLGLFLRNWAISRDCSKDTGLRIMPPSPCEGSWSSWPGLRPVAPATGPALVGPRWPAASELGTPSSASCGTDGCRAPRHSKSLPRASRPGTATPSPDPVRTTS